MNSICKGETVGIFPGFTGHPLPSLYLPALLSLITPRLNNDFQVKERYIKRFINGAIGTYTWKEDLRGKATDHTIIEVKFNVKPGEQTNGIY